MDIDPFYLKTQQIFFQVFLFTILLMVTFYHIQKNLFMASNISIFSFMFYEFMSFLEVFLNSKIFKNILYFMTLCFFFQKISLVF